MPSPTEITVSQLQRLIGTPQAPVIVDVCIDEDYQADPRLIPGSIRHPFMGIEALAPKLQGQRVVVVCHRGKKLSQGAAALLRNAGVETETLEGGIVAWNEAGAPMVPAIAIPGETTTGGHALGDAAAPEDRPHRLSVADQTICRPEGCLHVRGTGRGPRCRRPV